MEITKLRLQLSLAFELLAAHLEAARNTLARVGRGTADKLQGARRASENDLRRLQASFLEAIAVTKPKISEFRLQLSFAFGELAAHLEAAWNALARVARGTADKLQEARRASENDLHRLQASFIDDTPSESCNRAPGGLKMCGHLFKRARQLQSELPDCPGRDGEGFDKARL